MANQEDYYMNKPWEKYHRRKPIKEFNLNQTMIMECYVKEIINDF